MAQSIPQILQSADRSLASGDWTSAEATLRTAIKMGRRHDDLLLAWCNVMLHHGDVREGRQLLEKIIKGGPTHPLIPFCLALAHQADGNFAAARKVLKDLRVAYPQWHQATHLLVRMLTLEGKHAEAIEIIDPLLAEGDPLVICAFGMLASGIGRTSEAIEQLETVSENSSLPQGVRREAGLLRARLLDAEGCYAKALQAAERAHSLSPSHYDPAAFEGLIEGRISDTPAARISSLLTAEGDTARPIFILGVPRSGTSLTEAILGEHSKVEPLGECRVIERFVPLNLTDRPLVNKVSGEILTAYRDLDADAQWITDKQLGNFLHLDAIASLLPQARVIWCCRDRRDVAISCFFQQFQTGAPWADSLEHILHFEQSYRRLMQHWQRVLSLPILQLKYETLVAEPREQVHRMLDFLELEWEEQCMKFNQSQRTTLTASNQQVKEKIYRSSAGRWKNYAKAFDRQ